MTRKEPKKVEGYLMFHSKKGNVGTVASALFFIVIVGIFLYIFGPVIDDFRVEAINEAESAGGDNTLYLLSLYALMPLLWIIYLFLSAILIFLTVNLARGSPL